MKKFKTFVTLSLTIFLSFLSSAQEVKNYGNMKNPFDKIGQLHNDALDYIIERNSKIDVKEILSLADEYLKANNSKHSFKNSIEANSETVDAYYKSGDKVNFLLNGNFLSNQGALVYVKIMNLKTSKENPANVINKIKEIEGEIIYNKNLKEKERQLFLVATSVYRYSIAYWTNPKNTSKWGIPNSNMHNMQSKFSWGDLAGSDVEGAIAGGIGGAFGGSVTLPVVGTVAGWVAGAAGGAIGGSAANAIGQLTGWW
ncbi:hypothetical protein [Winogradskyella sp.]|jgi:hypothetical protein|uniref:hypothetical protein n=1 Tax=Winogradskyella sp. TaxID=1883156 RepID=UPI0025EAF1F8|nr:hypothetical protein [Winogradskyella sp.]MCT4629571.1 DUF3919 family protein [Winogradskyella sp.]